MAQRVLIVGGGIIGLATAWSCRRRGMEVVVVDRSPRQRDGCSFGNAGMVVPSHFVPLAAPGMVRLGLRWMWHPESPFFIRPRWSWELVRWLWRFRSACTAAHVQRAAPLLRDLHLSSRAGYLQLAEDLAQPFGLQTRGLLMLCRTRRGLAEESHGAARAVQLGVPAEVLNADQAARLEPGIRMAICGAVYYPQDCHLCPDLLMHQWQRWLEDAGCRFIWEARVTGFFRRGDRIEAVATERGRFEADAFVLCGGAWSEQIGRDLSLRLPLQAGKGYSLTLDRSPMRPSICAILTEARVAVTPMREGVRFGGTMEIAGLDESISPARVRGIARSVPRYLPDFPERDLRRLRPWVGLRPCSPDGLPYLGRSARWRNLVVATGHAMMGLSLAPVTGRIVADLLAGPGPPDWDLTLLAPERYA